MDDVEDASPTPPSFSAPHGRVPRLRRTKNPMGAHGLPATVGQFSFSPAIQTTVVTTTTRTTTTFPPLLMRPPKQGSQLDPKSYPLAATPTPSSLRNISFQIDGKSTTFREAADATVALEQLEEAHEDLSNNNGTIQTIETIDPSPETDLEEPAYPRLLQRSRSRQSRGQPAIMGKVQHHSSADRAKRRRLSGEASSARQRPSHDFHTRLQGASSNLATPESQPRHQHGMRQLEQVEGRLTRSRGVLLPSPSIERRELFQDVPMASSSHGETPNSSQDSDHLGNNFNRVGASHDTTVPTPPIENDAAVETVGRPLSRRALSSVPARLNVTESPAGQNGSLPSPSLSPTTATAQLQNAGYFADIDSQSEMASHYGMLAEHDDHSEAETQGPMRQPTSDRFTSFSVNEIPAMLNFFEAIPDELKGYVMHQLLRRCPKETLHVVADVVNPALKCDFLSLLPAELGLNIVRYLDLRSLTRASQVSRKWRQLINSDEQVWKDLFDSDGFQLAEGEMQQAIAEGWGWQDPYGPDGYERDISIAGLIRSETEDNVSSPQSSQPSGLTGILRRSKRKAASMLSSRSKTVKKRKVISREASVDLNSINWMELMTTAEGPYNAANAALVAVPHPMVGLPSLKGLHLYKTLYRRHYLIRKNWMYEDAKPRHIAFRAHDTHVVTCLQFDTDKILTGSDDNNINVYDTRSGVLRARLVGHEGGVWALQYDGNTLVSGSTDRSVRIWDIEKGEERQVFRGHTSTVRCLQVVNPTQIGQTAEGKPIMMPRQPLIITGSRDSTLRVWRMPRPEDPVYIQAETDENTDDCPYFIRQLSGHQHSVRAIAARADTLVSGSYDCTVRVWKISTGETMHRLQGHTQKVYSVVLDHTRNRCISGSMDNMVRIWSLETGSAIYTLDGHTSLVGLLDLNCDRLVSAAADSTLRIWDPDNGQCKATLSAHTGAITCFQHDGQKVISGSDRTLKLWDIKTGGCVKDLLSDLSGVWQVKFNERRCVAAVQRDGVTFIEVCFRVFPCS